MTKFVNKQEVKTEYFESDNDYYRRYIPYFLLFIILLFFSVFGITFSIDKVGNGGNGEIITDQIIFTYSDVGQTGNGINLKNAMPIADEVGKALVGNNQYFDFHITSSTGNHKVLYQLLVNKNQTSTLSNDNVRIYLTSMHGSYENQLVLTNFSDLKQKTLNNNTYYVLYEKILPEKLLNYSDSYRLRMWVKETANNYFNQSFSIKIDAYAEQVEE